MTYKSALSQFNALIRPTVPPKDRPAIREAWCLFLDSLQRNGEITLRQCNWIGPQR